MDNYQAGDFGTETDTAEATYDTYGNYDAYQGDYDANYTTGPGSDGQKAHHEFIGAMAAASNNNNNNSANKRPNNQNKRPQSKFELGCESFSTKKQFSILNTIFSRFSK